MLAETSQLIEQAFQDGYRSGTFDAVCICARLPLAPDEPLGPAEPLSSGVLHAIEASGGVIVRVAGELCIALFARASREAAFSAASLLCRRLGAAIGVSQGEVSWHSFGPTHLTRIAFAGVPLTRARELVEGVPPGNSIVDGEGERPCLADETGGWTGTLENEAPYPSVSLAFCAVRFGSERMLLRESAHISHLADEMDGSVGGLDFSDPNGTLCVIFGMAGELRQPERRAADFAIALRGRYPEALRAGVDVGSFLAGPRGEGLFSGYATVGAAAVRAERQLDLCEPGQIVVGPGMVGPLESTYALQPFSRETRQRRHVPPDVSLLLWREREHAGDELFVGREEEVGLLRDYIAEGLEGSALVVGPPGIGKSTLVRRTLLGRPASSILVVRGSDSPQAGFACLVDSLSAYWELPISESPAFAGLLIGHLDELVARLWNEELSSDFRRLRAFIAFSFGIDDPVVASLEPETRHQGTHDGWIVLFKALEQLRVVWVDDHQWLDASSRAVLDEWLGSSASSQLRVIVTTRTAPDDLSEADVMGRHALTIGLGGLSSEATRIYLHRRGITPLLDGAGLDALIERCAGNPFFLDQTCRYVLEEAARIASGQTVSNMPHNVEQIILARIERLSAGVRRAVEMASILGRRFDTRVLSAMLREEALPEGLQPAADEGIWDSVGELTSIFSHALIRETVYGAQLERERRELHATAAQAIEAVYPDAGRRPHLYTIAEHYELAGRTEEALRYLAEAAKYALENYENERAVNLLRRQKRLTTASDVAADRDLAAALVRTGGWDEALAILETAIDRFNSSPSAVVVHDAIDCFVACSDLLLERGETDRALDYAHRGIAVAGPVGYAHGLAFLYRCVGLAAYAREGYERALEAYEAGLRHAEVAGDDDAVARLNNNVAIVYSKVGRYDEALEAFRANLERSRRVNEFSGVSAALNNIGFLYNEMERYQEAMPYFEEDLELCTTAGHRQGQSIAIGNIASILASLGRHEEAVARYRESIEIDGWIGFLPHKAYNHQKLGSSLIALGLDADGCTQFEEALSIAERIDFPMVRDQVRGLYDGCFDE